MKTVISLTLATLTIVLVGYFFVSDKSQTASVEDVILEKITELPVETTSLVADSSVNQEEDSVVEVKPATAAGAYTFTGKKLFGWKTDKRWPIASITKLLSAYVAEQVLDPTQSIVIDNVALETIGESGEFRLGDTFQVRDLVKSMLMVSSNDAAAALSNYYGSTTFVAKMQEVAMDAGMLNSQFVEPTGLSVQNQSNVEDLVKLIIYIWNQDRRFFDITRLSGDLIIDSNTGVGRQLFNINQFAGRGDFLGGKTGTLPESDGNLVSVFSVPKLGEPVIVVVLGSKNRFIETQEILNQL